VHWQNTVICSWRNSIPIQFPFWTPLIWVLIYISRLPMMIGSYPCGLLSPILHTVYWIGSQLLSWILSTLNYIDISTDIAKVHIILLNPWYILLRSPTNVAWYIHCVIKFLLSLRVPEWRIKIYPDHRFSPNDLTHVASIAIVDMIHPMTCEYLPIFDVLDLRKRVFVEWQVAALNLRLEEVFARLNEAGLSLTGGYGLWYI
jgi:hypothetical protein